MGSSMYVHTSCFMDLPSGSRYTLLSVIPSEAQQVCIMIPRSFSPTPALRRGPSKCVLIDESSANESRKSGAQLTVVMNLARDQSVVYEVLRRTFTRRSQRNGNTQCYDVVSSTRAQAFLWVRALTHEHAHKRARLLLPLLLPRTPTTCLVMKQSAPEKARRSPLRQNNQK